MKKKLFFVFVIALFLTILVTGCVNRGSTENDQERKESAAVEKEKTNTPEDIMKQEGNNIMQMNVKIGNNVFVADLEKNEAVNDFAEMMEQGPVTIKMNDYSGFEKVGALGRDLSADNKQMTTNPGEIVLYQENQIVMFYGTNSWSYTKLGHVDDLTGWKEALGTGDVYVTFYLDD